MLMAPNCLLILLLASAARAQGQPAERILEIGSSVTEALGQGSSVAFFKIEIPQSLAVVSVELSGCGTGADGQPVPHPRAGAEAAEVKAFLSFATPRPSLWEAQHRLNWCADEPLDISREDGGIPPSNGTEPTVLHVSVYATAPAQFALTVTRGGAREMVFGELNTYVIKCSYDPANRGRILSDYSRSCSGFSVRIPETSRAVVVRAQAFQLPSPPPPVMPDRYGAPSAVGYGDLCRMQPISLVAALSMTAQNLTALPASWAMRLNGSFPAMGRSYPQPVAQDGELLIARSSPAFGRVSPLNLTIHLFTPGDQNGCGYERNATFSVTIGVFDAEPPSEPPYQLGARSVERSCESDGRPPCAPGCEQDFIADGVCHEACLTPACRDDGGDCVLASGGHPFCAPGCRVSFLGDGLCDDACFMQNCGWDAPDCSFTVRALRYDHAERRGKRAGDDCSLAAVAPETTPTPAPAP
jgi:hypothetical protein